MEEQRAALKARLMAKAEAAIDKMLADERVGEAMTMSSIEAVVGKSESDFRQAALEEIVGMQKSSTKTCPMGGTTLLNKGKQRRQVVSLRGEVTLERTYYECSGCRKGYFPPG
ncbi:MAG TPA: hypothetical protein VHO69_17310 [Phototrophicaceae bacterium]|nr:hypothetical protein [Phototrophicaceae bacterium]